VREFDGSCAGYEAKNEKFFECISKEYIFLSRAVNQFDLLHGFLCVSKTYK